jgi:hypothetical protein
MNKNVIGAIVIILLIIGLRNRTIAQSGPFPKAGRLDSVSVYGFSQSGPQEFDPQIDTLQPDIVTRVWSKWMTYGTYASDFDFSLVTQYHQNNIIVVGGLTATVYFYVEATDSTQFKDFVTRDAYNNLLPHNEIVPDAYRGNLANPAYRDYVVQVAKIQIDGGVDGLNFDEANAGYDGGSKYSYNGNEGFDDYHLKDFNTYLANKYPSYTQTDWISKFGMTTANFINTALPLTDLTLNFNYRTYLAEKGFQAYPLTTSNPLAAEWGTSVANRLDSSQNNFLAIYNTKYWKDIVTQVREYARTQYNKEILITSNGLFPYTDFNELGMYDFNQDDNGSQADYVPVSGSNLNGAYSLQSVFQSLYARNRNIAASAPLGLFIDWPTTMMTNYENFTVTEKMDYWRIYAAEAYANGLFMTFHLKTSLIGDATATSEGVLDFMRDYVKFYKKNALYYQPSQPLNLNITTTANNINTSLLYQPGSSKYTLHLVNHNYTIGTGMSKLTNITVTFPVDSTPKSVTIYSPDLATSTSLSFTYSNGKVIIQVNELTYYDLIVLDFLTAQTVTGIINASLNDQESALQIVPTPSIGGEATIKVNTKGNDWGQIVIYSLDGRIVQQTILNTDQLKVKLPSGGYMVQWNSSQGQINKRWVSQ